MTIRVFLSWPDAALSPNGRDKWAKIAAVKAARYEARIQTLAQAPGAKLPDKAPLSVSWLFCPPDGRHYDIDNMAARAKAYLDGVADALHFNDQRICQTHNYRGQPHPGGRVEMRLDVVLA